MLVARRCAPRPSDPLPIITTTTLQDPTWQLEWRCLQLLHGGTRMPYYALLAAVGEAAVERLAYLWSGPDDTGGAILNRFLMRRPHLFQVVLGDTIQLAPGGRIAGGRGHTTRSADKETNKTSGHGRCTCPGRGDLRSSELELAFLSCSHGNADGQRMLLACRRSAVPALQETAAGAAGSAPPPARPRQVGGPQGPAALLTACWVRSQPDP
jgi:hypothetical protein